jgi:cation transport regulator
MVGDEPWTRAKQPEDGMPYSRISDLPQEQVDQYSTHQKHAFLEAFNNALEEYHDEGRAFATAHAAAQRAPREKGEDHRGTRERRADRD